jgi:N-acetylglutamate synthase-like GNAT family acetyltransferase|tara:strand:- start:2670 stop:3113 length:444 start_codon:yes stop_codon:yes gene_type:complete
MKIRKATKRDFNNISNLIKEEYWKHYKEKWTIESALETLNHYKKVGKIFVGEIEKRIVGVIIIREEEYNGRKTLMVEELVVNGDLQGKGLGKKLMMFVEGYCKKNNIKRIWLITGKDASAFGFYKKIGYKHEEKTVYFSKKVILNSK